MLTPEKEARLREVMAETLGLDEDEIDADTSPQTQAAWTSFSHLTLMSAVEEAFGIQLNINEMTAAQSYGQLSKIVAAHL